MNPPNVNSIAALITLMSQQAVNIAEDVTDVLKDLIITVNGSIMISEKPTTKHSLL